MHGSKHPQKWGSNKDIVFVLLIEEPSVLACNFSSINLSTAEETLKP